MAKTTEQLLQQAVQIRDEQANKKNTALRVGTLFSDIIEKQEESDQTHATDVAIINEAVTENSEKVTNLNKNTGISGYPVWKPNTAYAKGVVILNSDGQLVKNTVEQLDSGGTYNPVLWETTSLDKENREKVAELESNDNKQDTYLFGADFRSNSINILTGNGSINIDNIYITKGQKIKVAVNSDNGGIYTKAVFGYINSENQYIQSVLSTTQGVYAEYTAPEDIVEWRTNIQNVTAAGDFYVSLKVEPYFDEKISDLESDISNLESDISDIKSNDSKQDTYLFGADFRSNSINILTGNGNANIDNIYITKGQKIKVAVNSDNGGIYTKAVFGYINSENQYIQSVLSTTQGVYAEYTAPEDIIEWRTNIQNVTAVGDFYVSLKVEPYNKVYDISDMCYTSYQSVRILQRTGCIGDSYTSGHIHLDGQTAKGSNPNYAWPHYMAKITGNIFTNFGLSGSTAKQWVSGAGRLDEVQQEGNKCQAYIIALMINDQGSWSEWATPVGEISDIGTDADTYYAWYYKLVQEVIKVNTDAKIFCMTCFAYQPTYSYNQAVRDIVAYCKDRGQNVFLCDTAQYRNASFFTNKILVSDLVNDHYSAIGYELMAEFHVKLLSDVINNNVKEFQNVFEIPFDL